MVIAEFYRYRKGRIFITNADFDELRLTGSFDIAKPEEALQMIRGSLGLSAYQVTGRWIFLGKRVREWWSRCSTNS